MIYKFDYRNVQQGILFFIISFYHPYFERTCDFDLRILDNRISKFSELSTADETRLDI